MSHVHLPHRIIAYFQISDGAYWIQLVIENNCEELQRHVLSQLEAGSQANNYVLTIPFPLPAMTSYFGRSSR